MVSSVPSSSPFSSPSSPSSSSTSFMLSASVPTRTQAPRQTLSAKGQAEWPDLPSQFEADIEAIIALQVQGIRRDFNRHEEESTSDVTLHDENDDDMDLWIDDDDECGFGDDEFSEPERAILPGVGVEGSATWNSVESPMGDATSTSTLDPMPSSSSIDHIPTREEIEELNDSINFLYQTLAVACIIIESYLTAYHRAYPLVKFGDIIVHRRLPRYPAPTLIEYLLRGPVNLIPLSDLQDVYGIQFPDTSTPPPLMPESFTLTPLDWTPPLRPTPRVNHHTQGSRPVDEALRCGPDWLRLIRIKLLVEDYFRSRARNAASSSGPVQAGPAPAAPISLDHLINIRRAKRVIKPLPKRSNQGASDGQYQQSTGGVVPLVGSVLGAAICTAGEAVVNGVKRLRDELEESGFSGRRKRTRID